MSVIRRDPGVLSSPPLPSPGAGDPSASGVAQRSLTHRAGTPPIPPQKVKRKSPPLKPVKESKVYKIAMAYVALRAQGMPANDIATLLGVSLGTVRQYVYQANRKGWTTIDSFDEPEDKLDLILRSKAVRNIDTILDETVTNEKTGLKHPSVRAGDTALEVAKGTGLLKQHQQIKSDGQQSIAVALRVQVDMPVFPAGAGAPDRSSILQVRPGTAGGAPFLPDGVTVLDADLDDAGGA